MAEPKAINQVIDSILSNFLPPDQPIHRRGRLAIPLHINDTYPELMRAIVGEIEIDDTYRAEKLGYQFIWGNSNLFEPVWPGDEKIYHKYDLIVNHANGSDYYTFARVFEADREDQAA